GTIGGQQGAVIGFVVGCIIAALLLPNKGDNAVSSPPTIAVSKGPGGQEAPLQTQTSGRERLHEIMRQIEASRAADGRDVRSSPARGIGVSISFGEAQPLASRSSRAKPKLTWYGPGEPVIH